MKTVIENNKNDFPDIEYLSDEELNNLILDIEENNLVDAPSYIQSNIIEIINNNANKRIAEYRRFRNQVIVAVAAILVIIPFAPKFNVLIQDNIERASVASERITDASKYLMYDEIQDAPEKNDDHVFDVFLPEDSTKEHSGKVLRQLTGSHYISNFINKREE